MPARGAGQPAQALPAGLAQARTDAAASPRRCHDVEKALGLRRVPFLVERTTERSRSSEPGRRGVICPPTKSERRSTFHNRWGRRGLRDGAPACSTVTPDLVRHHARLMDKGAAGLPGSSPGDARTIRSGRRIPQKLNAARAAIRSPALPRAANGESARVSSISVPVYSTVSTSGPVACCTPSDQS